MWWQFDHGDLTYTTSGSVRSIISASLDTCVWYANSTLNLDDVLVCDGSTKVAL